MKRTISFSQNDGYSQSQRSRPNPVRTKKSFKKPSRVSSSVQRAVDRALSRRSETKMCSNISYELGLTTLSYGSLYKAPTPAQGVGDQQRIGNKVHPVGLSVKTMYHLTSTTATECWVRQLVLQVHEGSEITDAEVLASLFEGTAGQDIAADGTLKDSLRKINRQRFRVLKDDQLILAAEGHNNRVAWTKNYYKLGGTMTFHDNVAAQPVHDRYVIITIPMEADGDESVGTTIELSYAMDFYYKE